MRSSSHRTPGTSLSSYRPMCLILTAMHWRALGGMSGRFEPPVSLSLSAEGSLHLRSTVRTTGVVRVPGWAVEPQPPREASLRPDHLSRRGREVAEERTQVVESQAAPDPVDCCLAVLILDVAIRSRLGL